MQTKTKIVTLLSISVFLYAMFFVYFNFINPPSNSERLSAMFDKCETIQITSQYYECIRDHAQRIIKKTDLTGTMVALDYVTQERVAKKQLGGNFTWGRQECHYSMHIFGEEAVAATGDTTQVLGQCTNACDYGCHHGALSYGLRTNPNIINQITSICEPFSVNDALAQEFTACNHGLGHALVDLTGRDLDQALEICDSLPSQEARVDCEIGADMEFNYGK